MALKYVVILTIKLGQLERMEEALVQLLDMPCSNNLTKTIAEILDLAHCKLSDNRCEEI